jgi:hypothetical protein
MLLFLTSNLATISSLVRLPSQHSVFKGSNKRQGLKTQLLDTNDVDGAKRNLLPVGRKNATTEDGEVKSADSRAVGFLR